MWAEARPVYRTRPLRDESHMLTAKWEGQFSDRKTLPFWSFLTGTGSESARNAAGSPGDSYMKTAKWENVSLLKSAKKNSPISQFSNWILLRNCQKSPKVSHAAPI